MKPIKLLLVDDEPAIHHAFKRIFNLPAFDVHGAMTGADGIAEYKHFNPDVVVLDIRLPDISGLNLFDQMHVGDARVPFVFITGHGDADSAIEAMKRGAFDYLLKPLELSQLRQVIDEAAAASIRMRVPAEIAGSSEINNQDDQLLGRSATMQEVFKLIGRVAKLDTTVLITGESGVGKELVARAIYQHSSRADKPFLAINCAAIPETLLEAELFGHERGAFTGADRRRIGKFERCQHGTLLLDEIGEMSPILQAKLLRLLQQQEFERIGGTETIRTDVRILAATNIDLDHEVARGRFRTDLYFRINQFRIDLPPLRSRTEDLAVLANHFARLAFADLNRSFRRIDESALTIMKDFSWPGNIRELRNVISQAAALSVDGVLSAATIESALKRSHATSGVSTSGNEGQSGFDWDEFVTSRLEAGSNNLYGDTVLMMERELLTRVMKHTGGNQVQAAKSLGIARGSLRSKLQILRLSDKTDEGTSSLGDSKLIK